MRDHALLERSDLLDRLRGHAEAARRGQGRLVLVSGEAGVGKSALVETFRRRHSGDAVVLAGACEAMSAPPPLGPVTDFAGELGEGFARLIEEGAAPQRLFAALLDRLRSGGRTHIVLLEDLHWADDATLDLLRYLGRRVGEVRALVLGTYRDDGLSTTHGLRRLLGDLASAATVHRVEVPRLSRDAVAELAAGTAVDPEALYRSTGGNAFFVTEVLASGGSGLPAKVGDAVMARVSRLSPAAVGALELAAVVGQYADAALLGELGATPDALDECVSVGLLVGRRGVLSFRHELARQAVLAAMPATRRERTHAAVLDALERRAATDVQGAAVTAVADRAPAAPAVSPAVLAHHAYLAGDGAAVLRYAPGAGRDALRLGAYREAREQFARSLRYADRLGAEERATLHELHAEACDFTGHAEEAAASRRAAADLLAGPEHAERRAKVLSQLTWTLCFMLRDDEAGAALEEAAAALEARPGSPVEAYISFLHGWRSYTRGEAGLRWARAAEDRASRSGNRHVLVRAKTIAAMALAVNERVAPARRELAAAVELATGADADLAVVAHFQVGSALLETFRCCPAERLLRRAQELARRDGFDGLLHPAVALQALAHLRRGRWDEAEAAAAWVLERSTPTPTARVWATLVRALLQVRRGEDGPREALEELVELTEGSPRIAVVVAVSAALAEAALARGDEEAARAEAERSYERVVAEGSPWHAAHLAYWVWRAGGEPRLSADARGPYAMQVRGEPRRAARRWARLGCPYERATALSESDDVEDLSAALRTFDALGARTAREAVARRLRALGVRGVPRGPLPATRAHPSGLTPRERQVLALMAEGLRNAEIAARNGVSPRTVDHQVSAVLGKLGVRSRAEAVAEAFRLGLVDESSGTGG